MWENKKQVFFRSSLDVNCTHDKRCFKENEKRIYVVLQRPLLITYSAWLKIYEGYMTGLVNVARSGDQEVNYFAKMLRVRVQLQFTNLQVRLLNHKI